MVFVHGSGNRRFSPRNRKVADYLNNLGFSTLFFDLLTADEHNVDQVTAEYRFDIALLSERIKGAVDWLSRQTQLGDLNIGLFGASTGKRPAIFVVTTGLRL